MLKILDEIFSEKIQKQIVNLWSLFYEINMVYAALIWYYFISLIRLSGEW